MRITHDDTLQPLTPQMYYVLLALADRPLHGYGIMQQIGLDSAGTVVIASGSLYTALKRLTGTGLIKPNRPIASERSPHMRHQYRLTLFGRQLLQAETKRISHALRLAKDRRVI